MKKVICNQCHRINNVPADRLGDGPVCGACKTRLFQGTPVNLTDNSFDKHIKHSSIPVLVDFWATWCGPCQAMAPTLNQIATELEPNLKIAKLETDQNPNTSAQFQIRSIPTLIVFKEGKEVARQAGAMPAHVLKQWLASVM